MAFFSGFRGVASRLLVQVSELAELTKPTFVNGKWRKPKVSARRAADIKKAHYAELAQEGKLDISMVERKELKPVTAPKMKMNKWWRTLPKRTAKIEQRMKDMPKRIAEYRQAVAEKRSVDPLDKVFTHGQRK
eukprot:CAMPEP_0113888822 /NCGR_PEP_ID=MMETSP0780_2-20120614/13107_1 /TAXON_ID=652834 /ORGANISM="Palpitomonas bilix" /LENGTH=132 /DNA_ID=CAMNT_0000877757 /DNA_START=145 /DNA_END=543 /DNA_ORIENTATION=- /assembly_acc=CAM_ASM_000599